MQISNVVVTQQFPTAPYTFAASASVVMAQGEIYVGAVLRVWKQGHPGTYRDSFMNPPINGVITTAAGMAPDGSTPPFDAKIIGSGTVPFTQESAVVAVGGPP